LFYESDGVCAICGAPLDRNWEADHVIPYSKGGETDTRNGQALCQSCNRSKGNTVPYNIPRGLREPQRESLEVTQQKIANGDYFQLNLLAPGTGKSVLAIATADYLFGYTPIERVIFVTIRSNLKEQIERDYEDGKFSYRSIYAQQQRHVRLVTKRDQTQLFNAGERGVVAAVTYNYVINNVDTLLKYYADEKTAWVLDEADRLGQAMRYDVDGTPVDAIQAAQAIQKIYRKRPGFMLMTTGFPYRHDGKPLILCDTLGYYEQRDDGSNVLSADVSCSLARSIQLRYLRPLDLNGVDGDYKEHDLASGEITDERISSREYRMASILKRPDTWQPLTKQVLDTLDNHRAMFSDSMKALITVVDNEHASMISDYIADDSRYTPVISTSATDADSSKLRDFRENQHGDVLITVQKASIGFDNKHVSVVGLLWNIRSEAANRQAIGRGMRWLNDISDEQFCSVIFPYDKAMQEIMDRINRDNEVGLFNREPVIRERGDGPGPVVDQETMRIIVGVEMDAQASLNGTDVQATVYGDDAAFFQSFGVRMNMRPSKGVAWIQGWEKHRQGSTEQEVSPDVFNDELDDLCTQYGCKRRNLRDTIRDRMRSNIRGMMPANADIGKWYQAAYAVAKRYNGNESLKTLVDPVRYHKLRTRIVDNDVYRSEVLTTYSHIVNSRRSS
jgi:superfamily II DNA or RNA helicase